jgi:phage terminase Nu1 subunit (DNA packaging protein)
MSYRRRDSIIRRSSVTIEAAAELTNVDVPTVRLWVRRGALTIEQRGDMEVVQLEEVEALAARQPVSRHGALRDRLRGADGGASSADETVNIPDLQKLTRERTK